MQVFWIFKVIYELLVGLLLAIVEYHRSKASYERKEKVYQPFRSFLEKNFNIKIKVKSYQDQIKTKKTLGHQIYTLTILILAILLIRHSVIEPYKIPSGSMIPTLKIGDHIFVNKLAYGLRVPFISELKRWSEPKRGDVVVFDPPLDNGKTYVKRLIGLPGDRIHI